MGVRFSTGVLRWSQSGKDHFTDVRGLFLLDLWVLWGAAEAVTATGQPLEGACCGDETTMACWPDYLVEGGLANRMRA